MFHGVFITLLVLIVDRISSRSSLVSLTVIGLVRTSPLMNKLHYYISQLLRALGLVNLAGRTLMYGPLNFKGVILLLKCFVIYHQVFLLIASKSLKPSSTLNCVLRWLETVIVVKLIARFKASGWKQFPVLSMTYSLMGHNNHSLSVDTKIMVSKKLNGLILAL